MPGYVAHLAVCRRLLDRLELTCEEKSLFIVGSVIPDVCGRNEKKDSHFWTGRTTEYFVRRPDIDTFLKEYGDRLCEPYVFGYYAHLKLDCMYLDNYWAKHFRFLDADGNSAELYSDVAYVRLLDNMRTYTREEFFSDRYMYGDYDRLNRYIKESFGIDRQQIVSAIAYVTEHAHECPRLGGLDVKASEKALYDMLDFFKDTEAEDEQLSVINRDEFMALIGAAADFLTETYKGSRETASH